MTNQQSHLCFIKQASRFFVMGSNDVGSLKFDFIKDLIDANKTAADFKIESCKIVNNQFGHQLFEIFDLA